MNRRTTLQFLASAAVLLVVCISIFSQDLKTVHDGVEYAAIRREIGGKQVNINLLRLDLTKVRLDVRHANDAAIGMEATSSIAARSRAVAAVNAGFFRLDKSKFAGDAVGLLMIDGDLWSESNNRATLSITNGKKGTTVEIGRVAAEKRVSYRGGTDDTFSGVNRERKPNEMILYTPRFGRTTLTDDTGTEFILAGCKKTCRSVSVAERAGNSSIPQDGYVISIAQDAFASHQALIDQLRREAGGKKPVRISLLTQLSNADDQNVSIEPLPEDATNGVPVLIRNGKIDVTWQQERSSKSFVETRHPRTAVAKLKDGKFLMVTVDGRTETSGGIGLYDLAAYLLELGAVDAMNLDGGGSTTMYLDGKVVNHPSDKEGERKVSDAIVVTLR